MTGLILGASLFLVVWLVILRDARRLLLPSRHLLDGRYATAKRTAEQVERSWMRILPGVPQLARYTIGCALHLSGELEASIAALAPLHGEKLHPSTRYAVCLIEVANLVLLGRDHQRASELLDVAGRIRRPPEDLLLAAHAKLALGEPAVAAELFAKAAIGDAGEGLVRLGRKLTGDDRGQREAIFHFLRGLYLVNTGRRGEAKRDLEIAARSPVTTVYVERARALLASETTPGEPDAPSSLAPQIVSQATDE